MTSPSLMNKKDDIQKSFKKYIQLKKQHFTEKRIAINWNELSFMGSAETVLHYHCRSKNTTSDNNNITNKSTNSDNTNLDAI